MDYFIGTWDKASQLLPQSLQQDKEQGLTIVIKLQSMEL